MTDEQACDKLGIRFDLDDPEVAREVVKMTFEGLTCSSPPTPRRRHKARAPAAADLPT